VMAKLRRIVGEVAARFRRRRRQALFIVHALRN
jgi:hypothetical protein